MSKKKLPRFRSEKEIREFWNTHSPLDFEDQIKPTKEIAFVKPQKEVLSLRMDRQDIEILKQISHKFRVSYSTLARMWIAEKLEKYISSVNR